MLVTDSRAEGNLYGSVKNGKSIVCLCGGITGKNVSVRILDVNYAVVNDNVTGFVGVLLVTVCVNGIECNEVLASLEYAVSDGLKVAGNLKLGKSTICKCAHADLLNLRSDNSLELLTAVECLLVYFLKVRSVNDYDAVFNHVILAEVLGECAISDILSLFEVENCRKLNAVYCKLTESYNVGKINALKLITAEECIVGELGKSLGKCNGLKLYAGVECCKAERLNLRKVDGLEAVASHERTVADYLKVRSVYGYERRALSGLLVVGSECVSTDGLKLFSREISKRVAISKARVTDRCDVRSDYSGKSGTAVECHLAKLTVYVSEVEAVKIGTAAECCILNGSLATCNIYSSDRGICKCVLTDNYVLTKSSYVKA